MRNLKQIADVDKHGERLLTPQQVAKKLEVPASWIYSHHAKGDLPFKARKIGLYLRFREKDVDEYIASQE
jgi:excisionase family DNA binding protein